MSKDSRDNMMILGGLAVIAVVAGIVSFFTDKTEMETIWVNVGKGHSIQAVHTTHKESGILVHSLYCEYNGIEINVENFNNFFEALETLTNILAKEM